MRPMLFFDGRKPVGFSGLAEYICPNE